MRFDSDMFSKTDSSKAVEVENTLLARVFRIMAIGLFLTGITSFATLHIPALLQFAVNARWLLILAEFGVVIYLSTRVMKMNPSTALKWFLLYSALNGLTLSPIFWMYTKASITNAFMVSGGMFIGMAIWGSSTKKDLSGVGAIATMGLFGIIIATVINIFIQSSGLYLMISYVGVLVFTGLTAWDVQKLKRLSRTHSGSLGGVAVIGALMLYLDFINLFLLVLRIMGNGRD